MKNTGVVLENREPGHQPVVFGRDVDDFVLAASVVLLLLLLLLPCHCS